MKAAIKEIRKSIIDALSGNISASVYNRVPSTASYPFVRVYSDNESKGLLNQTSIITNSVIKIEVVTRFRGDSGGELQCNNLVEDITEIIKGNPNSSLTISASGFNNYVTEIEDIVYLEEDLKDFYYFRGIITILCQTQQA